ncbi:MAG: sensor histidine kinase [Candidatus Kapabacteria bacterium]|nr:sensor histidine kinase [Candidatus Kapabacteria bacterium]
MAHLFFGTGLHPCCRHILVGIVLWLNVASIHAQNPEIFELSSGLDMREIHYGVQYFEDAEHRLSLDDVMSPSFAASWKTFPRQSAIAFGLSRSTYWLRFSVRNTTQPTIYDNWLFEVGFPPLDSLDVFVPQANGTMRLFRTGDNVPFAMREIQFRTFVVPLALPDSLPKTIYVRVRTTSAMILPFTLYTREALISSGISSLLIFGFILGVVVVLGFYNFALYLIAREQIYLRYLLYIASVVLFFSTYNGLAAEFIFPNSGFWLQYSTIFAVGCGIVGFTLTTQEFLQSEGVAPRLRRVLSMIVVYWSVITLLGLFVDYRTINVLQITSYLPSLLVLAVVTYQVQRKYKQKQVVGYFSFLNVAIIGGGLAGSITVLTGLTVLPNNTITRNSLQFSLLFDALMFSLALAQRFQILRLEKAQAQEETLRLQRDQNMLLQKAVNERTAELQQRNTDLAALNDEKTELMSIVAHDLKNPIGAVRSLADLVHSGFVEAEQVPEITEKIVGTADRMLELVTNLLDINRLEEGKMMFHVVEFDIAPLVVSTIEQYRTPAEAKYITLHYSSQATASLVFADEQATRQVLDNIISNAVKYSPHGKNVFVRVKASTEGVRVEVQDEGEGISVGEMTKLFGKFARLSARPTGGEHSTGLGLSIVKKMVEAMNGRVWCESELGKGATFIVELPKAGH